jgi:hypothetical protein
MCDYSLHFVVSRPARVGDKLVSTSFPQTTTRGFASVDDRNVAVCLLPGTELAFEEEVRCDTGIVFSRSLGHTVAKFQQVDKGRSNIHHDALEFPDGKIVLLTHLCKGTIRSPCSRLLLTPACRSGLARLYFRWAADSGQPQLFAGGIHAGA